MAQELTIEGKSYVSSKRAAELSGYAQDYIGQLARKQLIDARRIGGLWYVFLDSLTQYQKQAEAYKPQPPVYRPDANAAPDTVISFEGKDYVSALKASSITGYHQDYVGQLARSGAVLSRQIGNRWYVDRQGILEHKKSKDALLGAVQVDAVGLNREQADVPAAMSESNTEMLTYFNESSDLMPFKENNTAEVPVTENRHHAVADKPIIEHAIPEADFRQPVPVPIRRVATYGGGSSAGSNRQQIRRASGKKSRPLYVLTGALATIVIILTFGITTIKTGSTYTLANRMRNTAASLEGLSSLERIADFIEHFIPPLGYTRR